MHPVLGTMMPEICEAPHLSDFPEICEAPHLSDFPLYSSLCSGFNVGGCVHLILLILQRAPGGPPCSARSPLPVGCSPRPVTGHADRGIPQPSSF